jgi:Fic family protein
MIRTNNAPNQTPEATSSRLTLDSFVEFLTHSTIEETYQFFDYDYEEEVLHERSAMGFRVEQLHRQMPEYGSRRESFLNHFDWRDDTPPSHQHILRLFNQVNTFYAEQWAMAHLTTDPEEFLKECGRLILYRQGKQSGFRIKNISFGIRQDIDFMDPFRQFKILRGIAPGFIDQVSNIWADAAKNSRHNFDCVLLLAMALIAVHPFPDGNGRLARITFSWFTRRWGLEECWLAEDSTGEFLRTGFSRTSTEHLMTGLILELCGGHNRNDFGYRAVRSEQEDEMAVRVLNSQLKSLLHNDSAILRSESFNLLRNHLLQEGHFTARYPRFEALRGVIS